MSWRLAAPRVNGTGAGARARAAGCVHRAAAMDFFACCSNRMVDRDGKDAFGEDSVLAAGEGNGQIPKLCGLGIAFKPDKRGNLFVKRLVPGGPADASKLIEVSILLRCPLSSHARTCPAATCPCPCPSWFMPCVSVRLSGGSHVQTGDVLHAVDGKNVIGMNKMEVASLLMGPEGSKVRLRFLRQEGNGSCYKGGRRSGTRESHAECEGCRSGVVMTAPLRDWS